MAEVSPVDLRKLNFGAPSSFGLEGRSHLEFRSEIDGELAGKLELHHPLNPSISISSLAFSPGGMAVSSSDDR